jgi:hypothetical protein
MTSMDQRLLDLAASIGTDYKAIRTLIGALSSLNTADKSSVIAAINEVRATALANSGGGAAADIRAPWARIQGGWKVQNAPDFTAVPNQQVTFFAGTWAWKMWTPSALSVTQLGMIFAGAGAGCANWYTAVYGADGVLIPGSQSGDLSSYLNTAKDGTIMPLTADGSAISIPPGFFYLLFRAGTATTFPRTFNTSSAIPNAFLTGSNASDPVNAFRWALLNGWNTTTNAAFASLPSLNADYRTIPVGLR